MTPAGQRALLLFAILFAVATSACGAAAGQRNPDRIHADPEVDSRYEAWLGAGEAVDVRGTHATRGKASWYGPGLHGNLTASGEPFDMYGMTAAHRTLPFGTLARVWRPDTRHFVVVRINDRGPFVGGRVIDLSYGAAHDLGMVSAGVVEVAIEVLELGDGRRRR